MRQLRPYYLIIALIGTILLFGADNSGALPFGEPGRSILLMIIGALLMLAAKRFINIAWEVVDRVTKKPN